MDTKSHNFVGNNFGWNRTTCFVCGELLNGIFSSEGLTCTDCNISVHNDCANTIKDSCFVTHKFKQLYGFLPLDSCAACGTALTGIYSEYYKCSECSILVHPQCRTKSSVAKCDYHGKSDVHPSIVINDTMNKLYKDKKIPNNNNNNNESKQNEHNNNNNNNNNNHINSLGHSNDNINPNNNNNNNNNIANKNSNDKNSKPKISRRRSNGSRRFSTSSTTNKSNNIYENFNLDECRKEIKRVHQNIHDLKKAENLRFDKNEKPQLKEKLKVLLRQKDHLKQRKKDCLKEVTSLSAERDEHFTKFLKSFYEQFNKKKSNDNNHIKNIIEYYGNKQCREFELLDHLLQRYNEPAAASLIENEKKYGPISKQILESKLVEFEQLSDALDDASKASSKVQKDIYFPPHKDWLVRAGADGVYLGLSQLWVAQVLGKCGVKVGLMPKSPNSGYNKPEDKNKLTPRIILILCGKNSDINFDAKTGVSQQTSTEGLLFKARIEDFVVSGSALPMSFNISEASIQCEFQLRMEIELTSNGKWEIVDSGFHLSLKNLTVSLINSGSLTIADTILKTIIKQIITITCKKILVQLVPPELGFYMEAIYNHYVKLNKIFKSSTNQKIKKKLNVDIKSTETLFELLSMKSNILVEDNTKLGALDVRFHHTSEFEKKQQQKQGNKNNKNNKNKNNTQQVSYAEQALNKSASIILNTLTIKDDKDNQKDLIEEARNNLNISKEQAILFVQTQKSLGLTVNELFPPSDFLANQIVGEAARVIVGEDTRAPLATLSYLVKYRRYFLNDDDKYDYSDIIDDNLGFIKSSTTSQQVYKQSVVKLKLLWQRALDIVHDSGPVDAPQTSRLAHRMKRMVQKRVQKEKEITSRLDFEQLIDRVRLIDKKDVKLECFVPYLRCNFALKGLLVVFRDMALRVVSSRAGRNTEIRKSMAIAQQTREQLSKLQQNMNNEKIHNETIKATENDKNIIKLKKKRANSAGGAIAAAISGDKFLHSKINVDDLIDTINDQNLQQKTAISKVQLAQNQIKGLSELLFKYIKYFQENILDSIKLQSTLDAGNGVFVVGANDVSCLTKIDLSFKLAALIMSGIIETDPIPESTQSSNNNNKKKDANFNYVQKNWKRKFIIENDVMKVIMSRNDIKRFLPKKHKRTLNNSPESYIKYNEDTSDENLSEIQKRSLQSVIWSSKGVSLGVKQNENSESINDNNSSSSVLKKDKKKKNGKNKDDIISFMVVPEADSFVNVFLKSKDDLLKFYALFDSVHASGGLTSSVTLINDIINAFYASNILKEQQRDVILRFVKFLAEIIQRDEFYISSYAKNEFMNNVSAGDIYMHTRNTSNPIKNKTALNLTARVSLLSVVEDFLFIANNV